MKTKTKLSLFRLFCFVAALLGSEVDAQVLSVTPVNPLIAVGGTQQFTATGNLMPTLELTQQFAGRRFDIVVDRRRRQRRQKKGPAPGSNRRQFDRRFRDISSELRLTGFAVLIHP